MQSKERPKNNDIDNSLTLMIPIGDGLFVKCTFWLFVVTAEMYDGETE